jgi:hypothetical protein
MGDEAVFKARKRGSEDAPGFSTLGERMGQGGKQHHDLHCCGDLACAMEQGTHPKHSLDKNRPPKLGELMGQR